MTSSQGRTPNDGSLWIIPVVVIGFLFMVWSGGYNVGKNETITKCVVGDYDYLRD